MTARFIPTCVGNAPRPARVRPSRTVHPHVCGERSGPTTRTGVNAGSSPRVWGTQQDAVNGGVTGRFIPTCVGNAPRPARVRPARTVHPHVCGERGVDVQVDVPGAGSSPRVWGTPYTSISSSARLRFIPTCVGNALGMTAPLARSTVHPHVCGERSRSRWKPNRGNGSSPRVWGTLDVHGHAGHVRRFIPTCVGNAIGNAGRVIPTPVHPHVCGERRRQ